MSLDLVKEIFIALSDCKEWHVHLLSFTHGMKIESGRMLNDCIQPNKKHYLLSEMSDS